MSGKTYLSFNSDGHREQTFSHTNRYIMYWWGAQEKIKHVLKIWCFFFVSLLLLETTFLEKDRFYHTTKHWVKQAGRKSNCVQLASHSSYRCACPVCAAELQHCHFFWLSFPHFKQQLRRGEEKISYMKIIWMAVGWESAAALNKFNVDKARH